MDISVVIPLLDEQDSLVELHDWIAQVMQSNQLTYELIFIDDGSPDQSWEVITNLSEKNPSVLGIKFSKNFGKSQALHAGFEKAKGDVIITMDADLQDSPDEIPELFHLIKNNDHDIVSGWKKKRYDAYFTKNLPSKLFNWAARKISGLKLHDFNCGLKSYKKEVVKSIEVYGEMHRYIPVLAVNAGFKNIIEKPVVHQARKYGKTKFGMERFINGFLDLITIWFISRFAKRPMHFFGLLGVLMFIVGFGFAFYLGLDKLYFNPTGRLISERPEFFIALTTMVIGTQFFVAGFLGEIILQSRNNKERYHISATTKSR
ncbi:MAG: glycosyltransferase family 2 protein [Bacteroidetes bacterium]|nr:glycosyltransferase family 2 protein [Bacteroidota bacterium]MDA0859358.1 glycosyltransferase family 2 protein [Bacteroidota bacterium]MDA1318055.1 glycosyltransferase family 2 protein [Bacteroidota bacterium]